MPVPLGQRDQWKHQRLLVHRKHCGNAHHVSVTSHSYTLQFSDRSSTVSQARTCPQERNCWTRTFRTMSCGRVVIFSAVRFICAYLTFRRWAGRAVLHNLINDTSCLVETATNRPSAKASVMKLRSSMRELQRKSFGWLIRLIVNGAALISNSCRVSGSRGLVAT